MTADEMKNSFLLLYDLNGSNFAPGLEEEEVFSFINKAQLDLVKEIFVKQGSTQLDVLIETFTTDALTIANDAEHFPNLYTVSGPTDYLFHINSKTLVERSSLPATEVSTWIDNVVIDPANSYKFVSGALHSPIFYKPKVFIANNYAKDMIKVKIIVDAYTTVTSSGDGEFKNFTMLYLREPVEIGAEDCELNVKWHQDIVNKAVLDALRVTNDVRLRVEQPNNN
jgi:hypothetical protein